MAHKFIDKEYEEDFMSETIEGMCLASDLYSLHPLTTYNKER